MFTRRRAGRRRGAAVVEFAIVAPVTLFLIFAQIVGGMGVFRYLEVARLARDGARYASTHGGLYAQEGISERTGVPAIISSSGLRNYLLPKTVLLDQDKLQIDITWSEAAHYNPPNMPTYTEYNPDAVPPSQRVVTNNVIVTVTYQWFPDMFIVGPITLSSTSNMPMSY